MMKNLLGFLFLASILLFQASCSHDESIDLTDGDGLPEDMYSYDMEQDLLKGKVFINIQLDDYDKRKFKLDTNEDVDIHIYGENTYGLSLEDEDGGQYVNLRIPNGSHPAITAVPAYAVGRDSGRIRNFIFLVKDPSGYAGSTSPEGVDMTESSALSSAYGSFLGKATRCYGEIGNNFKSVLLFSELPIWDESLFTGGKMMAGTLNEITEHSFKSLTEAWSVNVGLGAGSKGLKGGFSCGLSGSKRESNDFEYYMAYYKVKRAECNLHMDHLAGMAEDTQNADKLLRFFNPDFAAAIMHVESDKLDFNTFYQDWGTDIITQGTLGGYYSVIFSREENVYEHEIGFDLKAYVKQNEEIKKDASVLKWYEEFKKAAAEPFWNAEATASYKHSDYFKSSKARYQEIYKGGNANEKDPQKWMEPFNDNKHYDQWVIIDYAVSSDRAGIRSSDEKVKEGKRDADIETCFLFPHHKTAKILVDAVETTFRATKNMSDDDKNVIANARSNIRKIEAKRNAFLQSQMVLDPEKSELVLCDVFMKNDKSRRKKGQPTPIVMEDPEGNTRTYYPMIANEQLDIKRAPRPMTGKPLDTNDDVFLASGHTSSHYWYYALAHKKECRGISDIIFMTADEVKGKREYDDYVRRGDHASHGLSGLLPKRRYVYVKFRDTRMGEKFSPYVTAFGLYDTHDDYEHHGSGSTIGYRIFASTGGAHLSKTATGREKTLFRKFWETPIRYRYSKYPKTGEKSFYEGGGVQPHRFKPICTTNPLPTNDFDKLHVPITTW